MRMHAKSGSVSPKAHPAPGHDMGEAGLESADGVFRDGETDERDERYMIRAAKKTLEALDLFNAKNAEMCVSELQQALGLNSNMAFRILYTLEKAKYIVLDPRTGKYHLSLKVFSMGRTAAANIAITKIALPYMQLLSTEVPKLNIALVVYEQGDIFVAEKIPSSWLPKVYGHVGRIFPIHATGGGKVLASELPLGELERVLAEKGLEPYTSKTITDREEFLEELATIRKTGIAWEREEHYEKLNAIAAAVRDRENKAVASICLSGFDNYVTVAELEQLIGKLLDTTSKISEAVGYMS